MTQNNGYGFTPGIYDPVVQTDVIPETEKSNQRILQSENNLLNELRERDQDIVDNSRKMFEQLGTLSGKLKNWVDAKYEKDKEEALARGAYQALINPATAEEIQALRDQENGLKDAHLKINKIANEIEKETGSFEQAQSFRNLSGWEQHAYVKHSLIRQARNYSDFKNSVKDQISVVINGKEVRYPGANEAERSALDAKVKFEFSKQFIGVHPVLLAETVGKEIQKVDAADFEEARQERDQKAKEFEKRKELDTILDNVTDDPEASRNYADFWVANNLGTYKTTSNARLAYADRLVSLVESGQLSLVDAIEMVKHKTYHSGDRKMRDMTTWKEWFDLEDRLTTANTNYYKRKANDDKYKAEAQAEKLKEYVDNGGTLTVEQKRNYLKGRNNEFPNIPLSDTEQYILYGYRDDETMRIELNQKVVTFGGVTERDLRHASPDIRKEFKNQMLPSGNEQISTINSLGQTDRAFVTDAVKNAAKITGELDVKSLTYYSLLRASEAEFVDVYNQTLKATGNPVDALNAAKQHLATITRDDGWIAENSEYKVYQRDDEYERKLVEAQRQVKPEDAGYTTRLLSAPLEVKDELLRWANAGGKGIVPYYYQKLASDNGILPRELAWRQAEMLPGFEGQSPDINKEGSKLPIPMWLLKGYLKKPTKNKSKRLAIDAPAYVDGEYKPDEYYKTEQVHPYEEEEDID